MGLLRKKDRKRERISRGMGWCCCGSVLPPLPQNFVVNLSPGNPVGFSQSPVAFRIPARRRLRAGPKEKEHQAQREPQKRARRGE